MIKWFVKETSMQELNIEIHSELISFHKLTISFLVRLQRFPTNFFNTGISTSSKIQTSRRRRTLVFFLVTPRNKRESGSKTGKRRGPGDRLLGLATGKRA